MPGSCVQLPPGTSNLRLYLGPFHGTAGWFPWGPKSRFGPPGGVSPPHPQTGSAAPEEREEVTDGRLGLLLLHPVPRALDEVAAT